ncbi:hypothetical protein PPEP_a0561 [Pseudoalteromonas peptidolytica F12-50-A1]|uniref:Uncharacterized protein n=1 Tax=Pseudoalteromonas peptidolytica F12-50-A1 TaxID=1315280 RepID=A0A8I0T3V8_9GAMM|nr:hypothetical protein [Pseudoalteromonas peptidolytica F12-50-A1]
MIFLFILNYIFDLWYFSELTADLELKFSSIDNVFYSIT